MFGAGEGGLKNTDVWKQLWMDPWPVRKRVGKRERAEETVSGRARVEEEMKAGVSGKIVKCILHHY